MTKITLNFLLCIGVNLTLFAQNSTPNSGMAIYKKKQLVYKTKTEAGKKFEQSNPRVFQNAVKIDDGVAAILNDLEFKLKYKDLVSLFAVEEVLEEDGKKFMGFALGKHEGQFYTDLANDLKIHQQQKEGKSYRVKNDDTISWNLTEETKSIAGYTCYKATTEVIYSYDPKIVKHFIEAWYTKEIPIPFGPANFGELPGLIVKLSSTKGNYSFELMNFKEQAIKASEIEKPTKGTLISQKEFEEIGNDFFEKMMKMREEAKK